MFSKQKLSYESILNNSQLDINLSGEITLYTIPEFKKYDSGLQIITMTGHNSPELEKKIRMRHELNLSSYIGFSRKNNFSNEINILHFAILFSYNFSIGKIY